jgi:hypothetical protein
MNVDCGRAIPFLEYLFRIFGIGSLQCSNLAKRAHEELFEIIKIFGGVKNLKGKRSLVYYLVFGTDWDQDRIT